MNVNIVSPVNIEIDDNIVSPANMDIVLPANINIVQMDIKTAQVNIDIVQVDINIAQVEKNCCLFIFLDGSAHYFDQFLKVTFIMVTTFFD